MSTYIINGPITFGTSSSVTSLKGTISFPNVTTTEGNILDVTSGILSPIPNPPSTLYILGWSGVFPTWVEYDVSMSADLDTLGTYTSKAPITNWGIYYGGYFGPGNSTGYVLEQSGIYSLSITITYRTVGPTSVTVYLVNGNGTLDKVTNQSGAVSTEY